LFFLMFSPLNFFVLRFFPLKLFFLDFFVLRFFVLCFFALRRYWLTAESGDLFRAGCSLWTLTAGRSCIGLNNYWSRLFPLDTDCRPLLHRVKTIIKDKC
jgi:hypothetical protein